MAKRRISFSGRSESVLWRRKMPGRLPIRRLAFGGYAVTSNEDLGLVVLGGLLMAFGVAASGTAVIWPSFAFALGVVAFTVAGLTLHEIST
jgi:hypothetical protein